MRRCGQFSCSIDKLHDTLCHPGITRLVKRVVASCSICAELRPRFYKPSPANLIKATQPFERLNIDFKGPLPYSTKHRFILTVIDEYTSFPFAFSCAHTCANTVIKCLCTLSAIFGMPSYIHSDRGRAFMSETFKKFLIEKGVAQSRTTRISCSLVTWRTLRTRVVPMKRLLVPSVTCCT